MIDVDAHHKMGGVEYVSEAPRDELYSWWDIPQAYSLWVHIVVTYQSALSYALELVVAYRLKLKGRET